MFSSNSQLTLKAAKEPIISRTDMIKSPEWQLVSAHLVVENELHANYGYYYGYYFHFNIKRYIDEHFITV